MAGWPRASWPAVRGRCVLRWRLRQFNPHAGLGHPCLGFSTGEPFPLHHALGNGVRATFCQIDTVLSQCCTFLPPKSRIEGSDHGGTNFDAARVQLSTAMSRPTLCRRDTGRALAPISMGRLICTLVCGLRCRWSSARVRQFGIAASLALDHLIAVRFRLATARSRLLPGQIDGLLQRQWIVAVCSCRSRQHR